MQCQSVAQEVLAVWGLRECARGYSYLPQAPPPWRDLGIEALTSNYLPLLHSVIGR